MIGILERCFADKMNSTEWQSKMKVMVPSYGESLIEDKALLKQVRSRTLNTLKLGDMPNI